MPTVQDKFPLHIRRPNLDRLSPMPPTPAGFRLRTWQEGDEHTVPQVLADAFQDPEMAVYGDQLKNFHALPGVIPAGCFVLETMAGLPVATAIGRIDPAYPRVGLYHQVAVRRAFWRRGFGSLVVSRVLHYLAQHHREVAYGGSELDALLFYFSLGFEPVVEETEKVGTDNPPDPWETAQLWQECFQLLGQTDPSQRALLARCAPKSPADYLPPKKFSDRFIWHDDFIVDEDGDLWETRATVGGEAQGVRFAGQVIAPERFVEMLLDYAADPEKPIFIRVEQGKYSPNGKVVQALLWSAGYRFSGLVGPR